MNLEARLQALESGTPNGYKTFDSEGNVVIDSPLPTLDWWLLAKQTLQTGSREAKAILRGQLQHSVRERNGGRIFELVRVMDPANYPELCEQPEKSC
jgi:hypothetical protein